jgi:hypothetical protein
MYSSNDILSAFQDLSTEFTQCTKNLPTCILFSVRFCLIISYCAPFLLFLIPPSIILFHSKFPCRIVPFPFPTRRSGRPSGSRRFWSIIALVLLLLCSPLIIGAAAIILILARLILVGLGIYTVLTLTSSLPLFWSRLSRLILLKHALINAFSPPVSFPVAGTSTFPSWIKIVRSSQGSWR